MWWMILCCGASFIDGLIITFLTCSDQCPPMSPMHNENPILQRSRGLMRAWRRHCSSLPHFLFSQFSAPKKSSNTVSLQFPTIQDVWLGFGFYGAAFATKLLSVTWLLKLGWLGWSFKSSLNEVCMKTLPLMIPKFWNRWTHFNFFPY